MCYYLNVQFHGQRIKVSCQSGFPLFRDIAQRRLVVSYRRFGKLYLFYLQGLICPGGQAFLTLECGTDKLFYMLVCNHQSVLYDIP